MRRRAETKRQEVTEGEGRGKFAQRRPGPVARQWRSRFPARHAWRRGNRGKADRHCADAYAPGSSPTRSPRRRVAPTGAPAPPRRRGWSARGRSRSHPHRPTASMSGHQAACPTRRCGRRRGEPGVGQAWLRDGFRHLHAALLGARPVTDETGAVRCHAPARHGGSKTNGMGSDPGWRQRDEQRGAAENSGAVAPTTRPAFLQGSGLAGLHGSPLLSARQISHRDRQDPR